MPGIVDLAQSIARPILQHISAIVNEFSLRLDSVERRMMQKAERGEKGDAGADGKDGTPGRDGIDGKDGQNGKDGRDGIDGLAGKDGGNGRDGIDGSSGRDGIDGKDGRDGIDGKAGLNGLDGALGKDGTDGKDGESLAGRDGKDGKDGRDGREGKDGRDGANGRDALDLAIVLAIDPEKEYPHGTWAHARGGLVRRYGSEWITIVNGYSDLHFELSGRELSAIWLDTSGERSVQRFVIPMLIYREVFKAGVEYTLGDVVTYGGSAWHCQIEATKSVPGTSTDWVLMVREGRRGKDGKDGEPGKPGKDGPAGRDLTQMDFSGGKH